MGWRTRQEQILQTASIKDRITSSEDTSTALHTARKQAAWIRRVIHAISRSKSYAQRLLDRTGYPAAHTQEHAWQVLTETDIRMDREVLAPLNEWLLQYDKMLALHRTAEDVRLEVDWRERQLAGLIGHLQHIASTQVSQKEESKVPGLKQRRDNKNSNLAGAKERYFQEKERLDHALAVLREGAEKVPMHLSVAFSMHSQAFAAASRALEEKPPVLMDTPRSPIYGHSPKETSALMPPTAPTSAPPPLAYHADPASEGVSHQLPPSFAPQGIPPAPQGVPSAPQQPPLSTTSPFSNMPARGISTESSISLDQARPYSQYKYSSPGTGSRTVSQGEEPKLGQVKIREASTGDFDGPVPVLNVFAGQNGAQQGRQGTGMTYPGKPMPAIARVRLSSVDRESRGVDASGPLGEYPELYHAVPEEA